MKRSCLALVAVLTLALAAPAWGQPASSPVTSTSVVSPAASPAAVPVVPKAELQPVAVVPIAAADEDAGLSYGGLAIQYSMKLGFLLLSLLLSAFVAVLLRKFGFQAQNDKLQDILVKAAGFAEQWSLNKAKLNGVAKPGGPEKMAMAIDIAIGMAKEYKLPEKGKDWWEVRLESWLGMQKQ